MDQLALVQDVTLLTKKLKATGLNHHLLSPVLFLKHEMGVVLVHFNWRCSESGSLRASLTSDSVQSVTGLLLFGWFASNLFAYFPWFVFWMQRYKTILSVLTSNVLASFLALWQAPPTKAVWVGCVLTENKLLQGFVFYAFPIKPDVKPPKVKMGKFSGCLSF